MDLTQVGDIQLFAGTEPPKIRCAIEQHQCIVLTSALPLEHGNSRNWSEGGSRLNVCMPLHRNKMSALRGGRMAWNTEPGHVTNWYDWALEWPCLEAKIQPDVLDQVVNTHQVRVLLLAFMHVR